MRKLEDWLSDQVSTDLEVHWYLDHLLNSVSPLMAGSIFYIFREAVWNAIKHAEADCVLLAAILNGDTWSLSIADNGRGLELAERDSGNLGLKGLATRARFFGGGLEVTSSVQDPERFREILGQLQQVCSAVANSDLSCPDGTSQFSQGTCLSMSLRNETW